MRSTRTPLYCCKTWQQIKGERCLYKHIISALLWVIERSRFPAFPYVLVVIYRQVHEITAASWHIRPTRLINLEDLGFSVAREREENQCQNVNETDLLEEPEEGQASKMGRAGNLKWIFKQFVWYCFVADTLERGFPSVLLSPWPVSASLVRLSHLSRCYGTSPLRPCHRPQRARPYHQSHRWATYTTGTSLSNDSQRSKFNWHRFVCRV